MHQLLRKLAFAAATWPFVCATASRGAAWALIADAGSTGTRVYLFHLPADESGSQSPKVDITDLGKGPALSSFKDNPEQAITAVLPQLQKAQAIVPEAEQHSMPVSVFATAGMRLVEPRSQEAIYRSLRDGLLSSRHFSFDPAKLQLRTISGREEGVFALLAANYLSKNLSPTLEVLGGLHGVLDLGGSSTQVAAPPSVLSGELLASKLGESDTFVRSFLMLGMERMRKRTYEHLVQAAAGKGKKAANPCAFVGYSEEGEPWSGSGDAATCEAAVAALLKEEQQKCSVQSGTAATECLSQEPVHKPHKAEENSSLAKFFLISGYMYVTDFARWWLQHPASTAGELKDLPLREPTVAEIRQAANAVCAAGWDAISAAASHSESKHRFTPDKKIPHRCFELNYIAALLSAGYGFPDEGRHFQIVEDIDGTEIEWTLGAFLHSVVSSESSTSLQEL